MFGYITRGIAYSSFMSAAIVSLVKPTGAVGVVCTGSLLFEVPVFAFIVAPIVWGVLLFVASVICLLGVLTRTWVGEYIGIVPIIICMIALGLTQVLAGTFIAGLLMLALTGSLGYRFYMVASERKSAIRRFQNLQRWYSRAGTG